MFVEKIHMGISDDMVNDGRYGRWCRIPESDLLQKQNKIRAPLPEPADRRVITLNLKFKTQEEYGFWKC